MLENLPCPGCHESALAYDRTGDNREFVCPRCGHFKASGTLLARLERIEPLVDPQRSFASSWIRERAPATGEEGPPFVLTDDHEPLLRSARPPTVGEQAHRVLHALSRRYPLPG